MVFETTFYQVGCSGTKMRVIIPNQLTAFENMYSIVHPTIIVNRPTY